LPLSSQGHIKNLFSYGWRGEFKREGLHSLSKFLPLNKYQYMASKRGVSPSFFYFPPLQGEGFTLKVLPEGDKGGEVN
jgi:hypothetical protein